MNKYLLWACLFTVGACSETNEDLQNWMNETSQQAKTNLAKPQYTKLNLQPSYTPPPQPRYNMFDPARLKAGIQSTDAPDTNRPKEVLEELPLEKLRYVGMINSKDRSPSAFIEANGHVYTVKIGNYLGQDYGRIIAITSDEVILNESIEDAAGRWIDRKNSLPLQAN